jgi:hypothetical protein
MDQASLVRVELHTHTCYSKDSLVQPEDLVRRCAKLGIDRFAVTDHNKIDGALAVQELAPEKVIVGEEIETTEGELIAYFVREKVPAGLMPLAVIERLQAQGAVISVAHPFDSIRSASWRPETLKAIAPHLDAVETFNARCLRSSFNREAEAFAKAHNLPGTVGSDAHSLWELGRATLVMPDFNDPSSFKAALRKTQPEGSLSPFWVHFLSRWAVFRKKRPSNRG